MCLAKRFKVKPREVLRNLAYSAIWRTPQSGVLRNLAYSETRCIRGCLSEWLTDLSQP